MSVKNVVKVMNFHSLLRVNSARRKVNEAFMYENEIKGIISSIVNNRIFKEDNLSIKMASGKNELNVYIFMFELHQDLRNLYYMIIH